MNTRIKDLAIALIIQLVFIMPFYAANVSALTISNIKVTKVTPNSATIEWNTDSDSTGKVRYGKTTSLGLMQRHDDLVKNHILTVFNGVESDTTYLFAVESTDSSGNTAVSNNSNSFYTFKTTDITPPPQVNGLALLSKTFNSISLSWNSVNVADLSHYIVYRNRIPIANSTTNSFTDTTFTNTNLNYKVSAVDKSNNEGPQSDSLMVSATGSGSGAGASNVAGDDSAPLFINASIPRFLNRKVIDIIGTTKPFSSVTLFVNDMNIPKRSLSNNEVGSSGKFIFRQIQLEQSNIIKIVAIDKSENKNEKAFEVSIDTEVPVVQLNNITSPTTKQNLSISGNVNEPVIIKIFVDVNVNESSVPQKVTGLNTTKVGQNSVELRWDESKSKDFSHYAVYRDNSPIAITKPANFNIFIDALVDSDKSYTYEVSVVSVFGWESQKSEPITATTLKGGAILNLKHPEVDIFEDFRKPLLVVNASNRFDLGIHLNKGDAKYKVKLVFEDKAGNNVAIEKNIILDTRKPEVKITSPPAGAFIYENVANDVDVVGKTEPNARVHLFIDRTPFTFYERSIEISGLPSEIQTIPKASFEINLRGLEDRLENLSEAELDSRCKLNIGVSSCRSGADRSVTADSQGNFKFEKIDLTALFGAAARIKEVPLTDFRGTQLNQEARESKKTTLVVIATDLVGHRGVTTQTVGIGTCWSGNQSWDVIPLSKYQSPTFLSTERLAEGTETIYFYFNYSYIGRGTNPRIIDVSLQKACSTRELVDPRFNISCQILPAGGSSVSLNKPYNTLWHSAVLLNRLPNMDKFLEKDWKGFLNAIGFNKELAFPLRVRITYEHEVIDESGENKRIKETQTTCEQVSYVVDNTLIDPRKLPDFLLYGFVDFLQNSVKTLTKVQEQIDKAVDYVAIGCIFSFGAHLATRIYRIWVEFSDEKLFALKEGLLSPFNLGDTQKNDECAAVRDLVKEKYGSLKLKYFSDADLKKCFPRSDSAWRTEAKMYQLQRWSCDRIFGHAAPSRWTEDEKDAELQNKIVTEKVCNSDLLEKGHKFRAVNCKDIEGKYDQYNVRIHNFGNQPLGKQCFEIQSEQQDPTAYYVWALAPAQEPKLTANRLYKMVKYEGRPKQDFLYAIKVNENNYMTKQPRNCDEVCGIKKGESTERISVNEGEYKLRKGDTKDTKKGKDKTTLAGCVTANQCRQWYKMRDPEKGGIEVAGTILKDYTISSEGYSEDCFYDEKDNDSPEVVGLDDNKREICCCVNGKSTQSFDVYYQPNDVDTRLGNNVIVHESKSTPQSSPKENEYADMKWSYRYWKEGYLNKKYNPSRYIEGRDMPACFGQNNLFYQALNKEKELLFVDPFKQHTAALQCVYLTGINQRLQLFKNIMTAMSNCLIEVRQTGSADAGVCKELFTQHVCGLIWQGIRFFVDGCTPDDINLNAEAKENDIVDYVRKGFKGITEGISDAQSELIDEYGNARLNDLLGTGEQSIARKMCLAAFGYDWELNVRNLVDAAYSTPFATLVQGVTRSREFLTVDPLTLRPKYEYRASWLINPGCDLERYDIQLACVTRKELNEYPNSINCGAIGAPSIAYTGRVPKTGPSTSYNQCDCLELTTGEQLYSFFAEGRRLRQNELVEKNFHRVIESERRYDHLKFTLRTDRRILSDIEQNCFPTGFYDDKNRKGVFYFPIIDKTARDIADCVVEPLSGVFNCGGSATFFSRKGTAQLIEVTINGENAERVREFSVGEELRVGARVMKTGKDKCFRVSLSPDAIQPQFAPEGITTNGTSDIPPITITKLAVAGRIGNIIARNVVARPLAQNIQDPITISVAFFDNPQNEAGSKTYSEDDRIIIDGIQIQSGIKEYDNEITKVKINGKIITIEKQGAVIEITNVIYLQTRAGTYEMQEVITVNPAQQATQTSQQKTLLVEIFNIKEDRDSYNNVGDCNLNDKVLERPYKFIVSGELDASARGPVIQTSIFTPRNPFAGQTIEVSVKVTHPNGVGKVEYTIVDSNNIKVVDNEEMDLATDGWSKKFDTSGLQPGRYSGNIKATSNTGTKSDKSFTIELKQR